MEKPGSKMMNQEPLVSVVIPTVNREHLIERAINSVLCGDYRNFQLLVVDQNSEDKTIELLSRLNVRFVSDFSRGAGHARRVGLDNTEGDFVCFLDSDDWLAPEGLNLLVAQSYLTNSDITYGYSLHAALTEDHYRLSPPETALLAPITSATLTRRTAFTNWGLFDGDNFSWNRWVVSARAQGITSSTVNQVVAYRGIHGRNLSKENGAARELFSLIKSHLERHGSQ